MGKILARGAEATIQKENSNIIKNRLKKSYRWPALDEKLRKQRTKKEVRLLQKAASIISVPKMLKQSEYQIELEFISGKKLANSLDNMKNALKVCRQIGENIAKLHDSNIIHGDLTTSNMILKKDTLFFIDFGLGFESPKVEDKAVDLHVIKEALEARHFKHSASFFKAVITGYKQSRHAIPVLKQLEKVESRGRYKEQY